MSTLDEKLEVLCKNAPSGYAYHTVHKSIFQEIKAELDRLRTVALSVADMLEAEANSIEEGLSEPLAMCECGHPKHNHYKGLHYTDQRIGSCQNREPRWCHCRRFKEVRGGSDDRADGASTRRDSPDGTGQDPLRRGGIG